MNKTEKNHIDFWSSGWTMFTTSKEEVNQMLIDNSEYIFSAGKLIINNYPFKPSLAFRQKEFTANQIINIDINAAPPTMRVGNELIFLSAPDKDKLSLFASTNQIPIVNRKDIWDWLLEPFLDTEYTDDTDKRLTNLLSTYGLTEEKVFSIRQEVKIQMLKYNFDTMLWDWTHLGAKDVLFAMRTKYDTEQFASFYTRVMEIALLSDE